MATVLVVTNSEICKLCRLDPADATADADATEVRTQSQEMYEGMLRPDALADAALAALLRRCVAKLLAAELLAMRGREDGAGVSFQGAGVTLGRPADVAGALRTEALTDLAPYLRRPAGANVVGDGTAASISAASAASQGALFGPDEADRARNNAGAEGR
jgi:hypothetical protein